MNKPLMYALAVLSISVSYSTAFARGADDGAAVDLRGHNQDTILKSHGADNVGIDLRGRNQDAILKRNGADNLGLDLRGHNNDVLLKRQGADDPAGHIRRAQGRDNPIEMRHAHDARGHR
jgi:hypothetical protein